MNIGIGELRLEKRRSTPRWALILIRVLTEFIGLLFAGVFIAFTGKDSVAVYV